MIAAIIGGAGAFSLYSDVTHQMHGKPATATLMEHIKECTVEYQRVGEEKKKEQWPCEVAEALQQLVGRNKIKISPEYMARVQFQLADGRTHEANVAESKLDSHKLPIGTTLRVMYAPDNPADVRAVLSWERVKISVILLAIGMFFLALLFGGGLAGLFGWAFRGRTSRAGEEAAPSEHRTPIFARASDLRDSSKIQRRPDTVTAPRPLFGMRNR